MRLVAAVVLFMSYAAVARAELEPGHKIDSAAGKKQREAAATASDAAAALVRGDAANALTLAEHAIAIYARDPWAHYVRAEALVRAGRLDDALPEYRLAEDHFAPQERWSRSIALWGRANAFHQLGRCAEAKAAFGDYIAFVKNDDARAVALAQERIAGCRQPWVNPAAKAPASSVAPPGNTPGAIHVTAALAPRLLEGRVQRRFRGRRGERRFHGQAAANLMLTSQISRRHDLSLPPSAV